MFEMILKLSKNQKLSENEIAEFTKTHKKFLDLNTSRSFTNTIGHRLCEKRTYQKRHHA